MLSFPFTQSGGQRLCGRDRLQRAFTAQCLAIPCKSRVGQRKPLVVADSLEKGFFRTNVCGEKAINAPHIGITRVSG